MTEASKWPMDFELLQRGDVIPVEHIESIYGVGRDHADYRLKILKLSSLIEDYFGGVRFDEVSVREEKGSLRILTHPEQAEHIIAMEQMALRKYGKACRKAIGVDLSLLTDDARKNHERRLHVMSFRRQQLLKPPPPKLEG